jgi:lycopene beta-cyclase
VDVDLAVVGAGGAGLSVVVALDRLRTAGLSVPSVALVDPVHRRGEDRTWCYWDAAPADGADLPEATVHRAWRRMEVADAAGRSRILDLEPLRYVMVRSGAFYARAERAAERLGARRVTGTAQEVVDGLVRVRTPGGGTVRLRPRWILDSRPAAPRRRPNTALLQHFRGWSVRADRDVFDPGLPVFMDFRPPQPARGVAFGYVLPGDARTALVEYTEFSPTRLPGQAYESALRRYLHDRYGLTDGRYAVEHVEEGAIPMTDAVHDRRAGHATFRIGTAGGATRGSTGYTFAAMQRQAAAIAGALVAGRPPLPPPAYPARHRWLDAVMLRALDRGGVPGPDLLLRLLDRNPPERVLRFLDGTTTPGQELRVMASAPMAAMSRAVLGDAAARVRRRLRP